MAVTAALVKELRERTGAGMMDCKKALTETNGDIELAIENMRKSGAAKAAAPPTVRTLLSPWASLRRSPVMAPASTLCCLPVQPLCRRD